MPRVFISYRRSDSAETAARIYDSLSSRIGANNIFKDIDSIDLGIDFVSAIDDAIAESDVVLSIIGPDWISAVDENGVRRLDKPDDYVAMELKSALNQSKKIIPVLVRGAAMPEEDELPESLKPIKRLNAAFVRTGRDFKHDMQGLIEAIEFKLTNRNRLIASVIALFTVAVVIWAGSTLYMNTKSVSPSLSTTKLDTEISHRLRMYRNETKGRDLNEITAAAKKLASKPNDNAAATLYNVYPDFANQNFRQLLLDLKSMVNEPENTVLDKSLNALALIESGSIQTKSEIDSVYLVSFTRPTWNNIYSESTPVFDGWNKHVENTIKSESFLLRDRISSSDLSLDEKLDIWRNFEDFILAIESLVFFEPSSEPDLVDLVTTLAVSYDLDDSIEICFTEEELSAYHWFGGGISNIDDEIFCPKIAHCVQAGFSGQGRSGARWYENEGVIHTLTSLEFLCEVPEGTYSNY